MSVGGLLIRLAYARPVRRQTYGYLRSCRALPLSRGRYLFTILLRAEGSELAWVDIRTVYQ